MKRIKVMLFGYGLGFGGIESLIIDWAKRLDKERFYPMITTAINLDLHNEKWEKQGIGRINLNLKKLRSRGKRFPSLMSFMENSKKLYLSFKINKPDIIHFNDVWLTLFSFIPAKLAGVQILIIHRHNSLKTEAFNFSFRKKKKLANLENYWLPRLVTVFLSWFVDKIFVISTEAKNELIDIGIFPYKVELLFNGIDLSRIKKPNLMDIRYLKNKYSLNNSFPILGIIGNLRPQKGHKYLVQAISEIKEKFSNVKLVVVGNWENCEENINVKNELDKICLEYNLNDYILFTGSQKSHRFIPLFDICLLPSVCEGLSIAALEYLAFKKPVILSTAGGNADIITNKINGLLVEPKNPNAIAQAVIDLLGNSDNLSKYSKNGYKTLITSFTMKKMVAKLQNVYINFLKRI